MFLLLSCEGSGVLVRNLRSYRGTVGVLLGFRGSDPSALQPKSPETGEGLW